MAIIQGSTVNKAHYAGEAGDASRQHLTHTLQAVPINDEVYLGKFQAGTRIDEIQLRHANLGANTQLELGVVYPSGTPANYTLFGAHATTAAGVKVWQGVPAVFNETFTLVARVKGGVAQGRIDVLVDFVYVGQTYQ